MKRLKFNSHIIPSMLDGSVNSTLRINDDKDISLNNRILCINRDNNEAFGTVRVKEVIVKQLGDINGNDEKGYQKYKPKKDIFDDLKYFYDEKIDRETPVKIIRFDFSKKTNIDKKVVKKSTTLTEAKMFADGGSRGNPGPSASGYVITDMNDKIVINNGIYIGITTNNQAEYKALKFGLEDAIKSKIKILHVFMDSLLVVNQINGVFKVRNRDLWPIYDSIKKLSENFEKISFVHVPREYNKLADAEVNKSLDANV